MTENSHSILWGDDAQTPELNQLLGEFASFHIYGEAKGFDRFTSMGVFDASRTLIAAMIYHNHQPEHGVIELSGAATDKRWLTRPVLREMYAYPFEQLGVQMVVQRNDPADKPLARMLKSYGFNSYRIPRLRGRDQDEIIFTLTDDDWRANRFNRKEARDGR